MAASGVHVSRGTACLLLVLAFCLGCGGGGDRLVSIASGTRAFCGVTRGGDVACGGHNENLFPRHAVGAAASVGLSSRHGCALLKTGKVTCWGRQSEDSYGALSPPDLLLSSISVGSPMSCGLAADRQVHCWGWYPAAMSSRAYLPVPRMDQLPIPADPQLEVCSGGSFGCAVGVDGKIACWGNDSRGQATPPDGPGYSGLTCGAEHACAIGPRARAVCWGKNDYDQASPPRGALVGLSAGGEHTCGLDPEGSAICWGVDLGPGSPTPPPSGKFTELAAGYNHTCGLRKNGKIECWGRTSQLFD